MRLLIVTQAVDSDDPILGFFTRWIEEFARHVEAVEVIALREGTYRLPENVRVYSLGKQSASQATMIYHSGLRRVLYAARFFGLLRRLRGRYDAVFVHMNPEYLALAGWYWRLRGIPTGLWYVHRSTTLLLRFAARYANTVFTSAPASFRVPHPHVAILGHGIDLDRFAAPHAPLRKKSPHIVSLGRTTPIKRLEIVIEAVRLLRARGVAASLSLVGGPATQSDRAYEAALRARFRSVEEDGWLAFSGPRPPSAIPDMFARADLSINACPTGGVDKAVLESLAAGVPAFVANESFRDFYGEWFPRFYVPEGDPAALAERIEAFLISADGDRASAALAERVRERAGIKRLVAAIMERYARAG